MKRLDVRTVSTGQSGATVRVTGANRVEKTSWEPTRQCVLRRQVTWLNQHSASRGVVDLKEVIDGGYAMERLAPLPLHLIEPGRLLLEMYAVLNRDVWSRPARSLSDWAEHARYVDDRSQQWLTHKNRARLLGLKASCRPEQSPVCDIHGDPTFANVMLRDDELVFIDPTPANRNIPSVRAVDLGKIWQSVAGYEVARFGWDQRFKMPHVVMHGLTSGLAEFDAARYFAAVHFLRLMPYTPDEHREAMIRLLLEVIAA